MDFTRSVLPLVRPTVPTQTNGVDCGLYVLRYAKASSKGSARVPCSGKPGEEVGVGV